MTSHHEIVEYQTVNQIVCNIYRVSLYMSESSVLIKTVEYPKSIGVFRTFIVAKVLDCIEQDSINKTEEGNLSELSVVLEPFILMDYPKTRGKYKWTHVTTVSPSEEDRILPRFITNRASFSDLADTDLVSVVTLLSQKRILIEFGEAKKFGVYKIYKPSFFRDVISFRLMEREYGFENLSGMLDMEAIKDDKRVLQAYKEAFKNRPGFV